jgi:hypothetical protein
MIIGRTRDGTGLKLVSQPLLSLDEGNFNEKVPMQFLGDTIKSPQKVCLRLYEKVNRVNTIDRSVAGSIS